MILFKLILVLIKWLLVIAVLIGIPAAMFVFLHPVFGGTPDAASQARINASPNYNGSVFVNLDPTEITPIDGAHAEKPSIVDLMMSVTNPPPGKQPAEPVPTVAFDVAAMKEGSFVWLGHSSLLMRLDGKNLLLDPVFNRASPIPLGGAPFAMTHTPTVEQMPRLDAVLVSHDHYDHLDYRAIQALDDRTEHFYVPLGVKAHLQLWGVADDKITELDWHDSARLGGLTFTLAPSRHFSGRRLSNRFSTLWGAWVIESPQLSIYFNGDSGYGRHFALNGEKYGPFDIAFMENGAYNEKGWPLIHMTPEQSVQGAIELGAKQVVPVHWAKFDLAYHPWKEPIRRFIRAAADRNLPVGTPRIGEVSDLQNPSQDDWWESVK
ncbi:MAG: MBL fold metallo-hydrolase [Lautropia sp.]|nr:MBL fold metallo-hydrolase [Lautropia sp.]